MTDLDSTPRDVRPARLSEADAVVAVLADAFLDGDLADWLVPDRHVRKRVYPDYFRMIAGHAFQHGQVEITDDQHGVALWYAADQSGLIPAIAGYDQRLTLITGEHAPRFLELNTAMQRRHPDGVHHYLAYLAVHPDRQGHGYGTRLLRHHTAQLDQRPTHAYLEATGGRNLNLYLAHGFRRLPPSEPITDDGCPLIYPMWREPVVCTHP
ncbi:GNAT family N-acetyltransferase [Actinoplanes sp. URMC 104]|uniref:GNAT family N-acetyltransferase n=1 Tax=Actinoplanes sp. URMC 104 TaxID=3423409 RepID=UPI003F1D3174